MLKDFTISAHEETDETNFVEQYWTRVWEEKGDLYGDIDKIGRCEEHAIMKPYLQKLPKGSPILDGGCGLGDWVLFLEKQGFKATGLDLSRKTIDLLQEKFPQARFIAGDIRETGFDDNSFDIYFSWGVFEHFENGPDDCIREGLRVLKPGGHLFMSVPMQNVRQSIRYALKKPVPMAPKERFYQYRFSRAELYRVLESHGYEIVDIIPLHKRQGVLRSLHHEFGLPLSWTFTRALAAALSPILPASWFSHMQMAVARKPS